MPMDWGLARDYAARDVQTEEMHVTEEWNTCTDPIVMIEFLRGNPTCNDTVTWWNSDWRFEGAAKGDDRKFRLFSCACCRRIWDRIPEQCNRDAVVAVEDFLEGYVSAQELQEALCASSRVEWKEDGTKQSDPGYWAGKYLGSGFYKMTAAASALLVASQVMFMADEEYGREARHKFNVSYYAGCGYFLRAFQWPLPVASPVGAERATQADLLRCVFGPLPFCPVDLNPAWRSLTVSQLAASIYESRDFTSLPILADALEDAGCTDADLLDHLRSPGPHVRGCWAVDLVLGKTGPRRVRHARKQAAVGAGGAGRNDRGERGRAVAKAAVADHAREPFGHPAWHEPTRSRKHPRTTGRLYDRSDTADFRLRQIDSRPHSVGRVERGQSINQSLLW
jgi:hypothetical protein